MSGLNLVKIVFTLLTFNTSVLSGLMNTVEKYLPIFIVRTFRYGKFTYKGGKKSVIKPIEVPKSWFKHFYVFASILTLFAFWFIFGSYVLNISVPLWLRLMLSQITSNQEESKVSASATLLAITLCTIQSLRRFYETHYVSVFGSTSFMNLAHYLIGFIHYWGVVFAIILEAPNFNLNSNKVYYFRWNDLSHYDILATLLFIWAWFHQYKAAVILANLRKNHEGKVVSHAHFMPKGDWFKYVSSPHSLAEILIYFSLTIILWKNSTWKYIFAWVLTNQVATAVLTHRWYKETFSNYPEERKILFPFIF